MIPPRRLLPVLGQLAGTALEATLAWLLMAPALVGLWMGVEHLSSGGALTSGGAWLALGITAIALAATVVARPLSWADRHRLLARTGRPAWIDARQFVWLAATLTLRSAVAIGAVVLLVTGTVGIAAPWLVRRGDHADLGPWHITTTGQAIVAALVGVVLLTAVAAAAPRLARADRRLAHTILLGHEEQLSHELKATSTSRARIVTAHDQERRRIERDLHDGIQPELLGVSMTLGLALAAMPDEAPGRELVARAQQQSLDVLDSLRRYVRGIHPQVLDDHGLAAALNELADTLPTPTMITDHLSKRLPAPIEASLYYATAELLTNVAKHANAHHAVVSLAQGDVGIVVTVRDDGRGGADPDGRGLTGVRDRLAALDGTLEITSPPGGPTAATICLPETR